MSTKSKKNFTDLDGIFIISSCSIGGSILAIPSLVKHTGIILAILILFFSYIFTIFLHLMIAEASLNTFIGAQFIDIFSKYLPYKFLKKLASILVPIMIILNLSMYIIGSSIILSSFFNISIILSQIIFYLIGNTIIFFSLKTTAKNEGVLVSIICTIVLSHTIMACTNGKYTLPLYPNNFLSIMPLYSISIFCLGAFVAVPQVVNGLQGNVVAIKKSICIGIFITLVMIILISISSILISKEITDIATIDIGHELGTTYFVIYNTFAFLAMLSSYWILCNVLKTIAKNNFHTNKHILVIVLTASSLLISLLLNGNYIKMIEVTSGVMSIIIILLVIPSYINSIKNKHIVVSNIIEKKFIIFITLIAYFFAAICCLF